MKQELTIALVMLLCWTRPAMSDEPQKNVLNMPLQQSSPLNKGGFYRDGYCRTGSGDTGVHVIAATVTKEFLEYTKSKGNDLTTPLPQFDFPGLKPGDSWCLCAARWQEAEKAGVAPPVNLAATHQKALETIPLATLKKYETK